MSKRFSRFHRLGYSFPAIVATTVLVAVGSAGKPPAPPTPPPAGSILYLEPYLFEDYQMKGDGTARTPLLPNERYLHWSQRRYGADGARWFIRWENIPDGNGGNRTELFATRVANGAVTRKVQVTSVDPFIGPGDSGFIQDVRWTKGTDGFISLLVNEFILDEFGQPVDYGRDQFYRLNVSAEELEETTANGGSFTPVALGDPDLAVVFDDIPPKTTNFVGDFGWSPDGTTLAWARDQVLEIYRGLDSVTPTVQVMPTTAYQLNWSAQGDKIVASGKPYNNSSTGLVRVDPVAGTAVLIKAATTSASIASMYYAAPAWSPSGTHLVALKRVDKKGGGGETAIVRLNADGSGEVKLNVLGYIGGGNNFVWDWVSDDIVP